MAKGRGRSAEQPQDIPRRGWRDILLRTKQQMGEDRLSIIAAGVAFYALMAIFPALIAMVAIYGLAADPAQVERHVASVSSLLPRQAAELLLEQLHDLVGTSQGALGVGAIGGLVLALWSAAAGIRTLMQALNVAYGEEERRGFLKFHATALALTLGTIVAAALAIGILVALPIALKFLGLSALTEALVVYGRWLLVAVAAVLALSVLYRYGPSRDAPRWSWASWGAVIATALWLGASALFSLYVREFGKYNETYGSVGAVVILLMWFLLSAYAVLIGAEINAEMERQTLKDTTRGRPRPLGKRRAYAADTVGRSP